MNSPLASTPSIASRMRGNNGSYWAFTSTSGIGRTISKSRLSPAPDQIAGQSEDESHHRVLDVAEVVVEALVASARAVPDTGERERPDRRADGGQDDVAPERHPEDPRRNRDERADHRSDPAQEHRKVVPAVEPLLRAFELVAGEVEP